MNHLLPTRLAITTRPRATARRIPASTAMQQSMQLALTLPLLDRNAALQRLGIPTGGRLGASLAGEAFTTLQAIALMHLLRTHAAELQRAAEDIAEATQGAVAAVARDAYDRALQQPDLEGAIEAALQPLFDLCG
jgi:hypothetical protein